MSPQYVLPQSQYTTDADLQAAVGQLYHVGFSNGTVRYGYCLYPDASPQGGWHEKTDVAAKDQLIQYSSTALIDRDFVYWPRVSQGDFSGGMLQPLFLAPNQYFDSDLDARIAGYLALSPAVEVALVGSENVSGNAQMVAFGGGVALVPNNGVKLVYLMSSAGTVTSFTVAAVSSSIFLDTDGKWLYVSDGTTVVQTDGTTFNTVCTAINGGGAFTQMWVIPNGTAGYFLYYFGADLNLYKIDLTAAFPVAAGAQAQVPLGKNPVIVVDIVAYGSLLGIVTTEQTNLGAAQAVFDVWTHDGTVFSHLTRVVGYAPRGICEALGNLYVTANTLNGADPPALFQISGGAISQAIRFGLPTTGVTTGVFGQPRAYGEYVYVPALAPPINGVSAGGPYVVTYNVRTGAVYHGPPASNFKYVGIRTLAINNGSWVVIGQVVVAPNPPRIRLAYQAIWNATTFAATGTLVTSKLDCNTPSIEKRFRRVEAITPPLPANCSVTISAFIDKDPTLWTSSLTPDATVTNSTAGTTSTELFMDQLIGHSIYFVFQLATSDGLNTPVINWYSVEITTPFSWPMRLTCTEDRRLLNGAQDSQGVMGKDLYYLFRNAWETPAKLTMFHRNGNSYTVAIESSDAWNPSPHVNQEGQTVSDEEYVVDLVLRQTL